jgi:hypothetical protein
MKRILNDRLSEWRLHLIVVVLVIIAETIYIHQVPLGPGTLLLLPFLYAFLMALLINPHVVPAARRILHPEQAGRATPWIMIAIMPFIAKFGSTVGPAIEPIIEAGPALLLQELGNLGTVLVALPVAVLLLRMHRETIGATFSIAREPNIAIISDRYSLKSPEGTGVMGVYVCGTLFGTIVFAFMASFAASSGVLHPYALAMACGVGSASMLAACTGSITPLFPEMEDQIIAYAGASNLLTYATGLYVGLFIALPMAERLYRLLHKGASTADGEHEAARG